MIWINAWLKWTFQIIIIILCALFLLKLFVRRYFSSLCDFCTLFHQRFSSVLLLVKYDGKNTPISPTPLPKYPKRQRLTILKGTNLGNVENIFSSMLGQEATLIKPHWQLSPPITQGSLIYVLLGKKSDMFWVRKHPSLPLHMMGVWKMCNL